MSKRNVAIACESTACLPPDLVRRYAIHVVPVPFVFGSTTFHDGVDLTTEGFYDRLERSSEMPKTSPPEPGAYLEAWQAAASECAAILLVTVAGRIGTFERSAQLASVVARERLPGVRIHILDSGSAAMGQGFVALAAARAALFGADLDTVIAEAQRVAARVNLVVALDTLHYLARTSRIPQVASVVSSVLDLKPLFRVVHGDVQPMGRVRSRRRSLERLVEAVCSLSPAEQPLHLAIHHARASDEANRIRVCLSQRRQLVEDWMTEFTPVMGAYCGPGLVGAAFYANGDGEAAA